MDKKPAPCDLSSQVGTGVTKPALILSPFSQDALSDLRRDLLVIYESWTNTRKLYAPQELCQRIDKEGIGILVIEADFVFDEVFQGSSSLEFLGVCRNSVDHIDVEAATEHGVLVVNTPGRNAQAVAELTIGLMLFLARGIPSLNGYVKSGTWENPVEPYICMRGVELGGKTLGIIGLGSIGRTVARLGRAFGMTVLAFDPYVGVSGERKAGVAMDTLERVLTVSDFLSIHTPETQDTRGLLDAQRLDMMKPGACIINTAAYSIIEEAALVRHLRAGHIAGAAFDVHRSHPIPPSSPLLKLDNVILTPHIGGATDGTLERQSRMMVEDIRRYLQGRRPKHLVNRAIWGRRG